jgi:hypothetical protein
MSQYELLTVGNPKTAKGKELGYAVAVLHLAPSTLSGHNVCPMASDGCIAACLNTAGRGGIIGLARQPTQSSKLASVALSGSIATVASS